jgi:hypothetical protein
VRIRFRRVHLVVRERRARVRRIRVRVRVRFIVRGLARYA